MALVAVTTIVAAAPASAHATLVASSPTSGQHLAHPPADGHPAVRPTGGADRLRHLGPELGRRHGQRRARRRQPDPDTVTIHLRRGLPDGAYVADYTVDSADGHIVSGGVVFVVGVASPGRIGVLARHGPTAADDLGKFGQFLTYLGVLAASRPGLLRRLRGRRRARARPAWPGWWRAGPPSEWSGWRSPSTRRLAGHRRAPLVRLVGRPALGRVGWPRVAMRGAGRLPDGVPRVDADLAPDDHAGGGACTRRSARPARSCCSVMPGWRRRPGRPSRPTSCTWCARRCGWAA